MNQDLKSYRKKLINEFNVKFDELFEIKSKLISIDEKYDEIYNDDSIEEEFQDIEMEDYDTLEDIKIVINRFENVLKKIDDEIKRCNKLLENSTNNNGDETKINFSLLGNLFNLMFNDKNKKNVNYEDYQYEEEELEDDDYHFDDLD